MPNQGPEIIETLGELMERYATAILDTSKLPAPKQEIKRAIKDASLAAITHTAACRGGKRAQ
jgi:hypothetical protein